MKQIFIAGDSTAANKKNEVRPESGWGEFLQDYFEDNVVVFNQAINGRSTKSFIDEGSFNYILDKANMGDYLIIQFGHNDSKEEDPSRYTDFNSTYKDNIKFMFNKAQEKKMKVIILSSISRANFSAKNTVMNDDLSNYAKASIEVAQSLKTPYIDMFKISSDLFNRLGMEKTLKYFLCFKPDEHPNYPNGIDDHTHLNLIGASLICDLIVKEIVKLELDINNFIKGECE